MLNYEILNNVRAANPVVVTFANFVTPQIVANAVNVIGGSPIMSLEPLEADDMVTIANAVTLNLGTGKGSAYDMPELVALGTAANRLQRPVIIDPVAVNIPFRSKLVEELRGKIKIDIIRGNASEIAYFANITAESRGIDAVGEIDVVTVAKTAAHKTGAIIALTGARDVVTDGETTYVINNNTPLLATNVGSGDMLSSLIGAFVLPHENHVDAVATAVLAMGVAGQLAAQTAPNKPGTFAVNLLDELYQLTPSKLQAFGDWELVK
ncbi:hydroxyethylthiazole kinase [Periweissella cryptocerci]|uniref:Hydroxyethylthiazole kinase n=1 Tax=Periweissella cryptocerci TaxID=2506420 RepID=A0A4P6YWX9_9LACO|nr:hydroxyethylthiazole kinase [Periweissella cryptocerci]QBO37419.1 hydroxyethylthiazole kinase [Periweissella cryptocerci]